MGTQIGEVSINLRMSLAQFKTDTQEGTRAASEATKQMASEMGSSVTEARGSIMLLSEEVGVTLPRHLTTLIAQIPGLSAAFAAMLPLVGVAAAIMVIEKLVAAHEKAKEAMSTALSEMGASGATVLGNLNEKLDASKLKFMELTDNGAGALALKLDMLSHQTLTSLVGAFDSLGKSISDVLNKMGAEGTFARIMGLAGASDAIKNLQHDVLQIRASGESDVQQAAEIGAKIEWYKDKAKSDLAAMKADQDLLKSSTDGALMAGGGHSTDKQITEQEALYTSLDDMAKASALTQQTAAVDTGNLKIEAANKVAAEEEKVWLAQNAEYQKSLKADEAAEGEAYKQAVSGIQESEKQKIDATKSGTAARLAAITAAIEDEEAHGLQDTAFFKSLEEDKIKTVQKMADEQIVLQRKVSEELGKAQQQMITLQMAAVKGEADYEFKIGVTSAAEHIAALRAAAAEELALERSKNAAMLAEMSANDPDRPQFVQKMLDADAELQAKYQEKIVALDQQAMEQRKAIWDVGFNAMNSGMTSLVTDLIKGHASIGQDLKNTLESMMSSWVSYFMQLEMKSVEAALFMKLQALTSFVPGVPGMTAGSMPAGGALPGGGSFLGGLAGGGPMSAGDIAMVGDGGGPELWAPDRDGRVIPLSDVSTRKSGDTHNTLNNFTFHGVTDFDSFGQNQSQLAAAMHAAMTTAARRKG